MMKAKVSKMSKENFEFYRANLDELLKKYRDSFVVIKNKAVIGAHGSFEEAYEETIKTEELGTFIIQHCVDADAESYVFVSGNVAFV
jgi:ABC-type Zn uptake system ZnuABC Zn-binding protein ZnuA